MKKNMTLIAALCILFTGCSDFLEVDTPKDQVDAVQTFNDEKTAVAAVNSAYILLGEDGFFGSMLTSNPILSGCYTDELEATIGSNTDFKNFYEGSVTSSSNAVRQLWNKTYKQIYIVNNILESLENSTGISENLRSQLRGEALAIRGLMHFYLTQTFGNVPFVSSTNYKVNAKIGKQSVAEVMNLSVLDLEEAEKLLIMLYPGPERIRINQSTVHALLARMHLYTGNWEKARTYAQLVIANGNYKVEPLEVVFKKESRSAIWQLKPTMPGFNTFEAFYHIFTAVPAPFFRLHPSLLDAFEPADKRRQKWVQDVGETEGYAHAFKYQVRGSSATSEEYSVILRLEEMYLIAAEAAVMQGDLQNGSEMLNVIRSRAGLDDLDFGNVQQGVDAILKERRMEFFCEFGHRFYDLKRLNRLSDLMVVKPRWQQHFIMYPLPENEITLNPNLLPQNAGY
ncbi:SusD family protein [Sphingobacterium nematocida]|uniref:SusD family protein n=1 Tax=Sphingobacterium nematocida TaxID=1513896 RepID=A0A1T5EK78_9SPHI|nr:RagB/SusD family nutrient uptake outer membrane protein [Sphingobacterium nematocida]SKB84462.1 SusD family protein [Sphingobacterium nematocida]